MNTLTGCLPSCLRRTVYASSFSETACGLPFLCLLPGMPAAQVKAGQPIEQYRAGAEFGRQLKAVDAAAKRGSEQAGGTGQPSSNIENAIFGPNLRQLQQLA
ncbi:MAG TPA: hypothetical protein VF319_00370 [Caldimonas sp.]